MAIPDDALLERAVQGDRDALVKLLESYGPQVRSSITGGISPVWRSTLDEDDVMQVTYTEAFLRIASFKPAGVPSFVAWLKRIADNNLRDAIKGLAADKRPDPRRRLSDDPKQSFAALYEHLAETSSTPSRAVASAEAVAQLQSALDRLPADYREVVRRCDLSGEPVSDVAAAMKRSPGAVFMLRSRAHEAIRSLMPSASNVYIAPR